MEMTEKMNEVNASSSEEFQDEYDKYVTQVSMILNGAEPITPLIEGTLRDSLVIVEECRRNKKDLDYFREKFNAVPPLELEMSSLKNCYIGKCRCGQFLIQNRDHCCPRCRQFVAWPPKEKEQ